MIQVYDPSQHGLALEMHNAPDRVSAILGVAFVEEKLTEAIKSRLLNDKDAASKLFKPSGPIGAYASKVELGYLLGLYKKETRNDLLILGEIRNSFAHWTKLIDFGSREIRPKCENLTLYERVFGPKIDRPKPFDRRMAKDEFLETVSIAANICHSWVFTPNHPNIY